jgi:K+-transporting ATPase ATPase A chain
MTPNGWLQIAFFSICFLLVAKPLGLYLVRVFDGSVRWLRPVENLLYRISGVNPQEDQHWTRYAAGMLLFSGASMLLTYVALRVQHLLPLNPQAFAAVPDRQAFETAASFTTNTNWQSYSGESMMSYLSQMMQLAFHNFISAAVGIALAVALVRGIARRGSEARGRLGNFWADLVRCTLYVLLPLSLIAALFMVQQGVIQNFKPYLEVTTLGAARRRWRWVSGRQKQSSSAANGGGLAQPPIETDRGRTSLVLIFAPSALPGCDRMVPRRLGGVTHVRALRRWSAPTG